jgi:hypothetical protein
VPEKYGTLIIGSFLSVFILLSSFSFVTAASSSSAVVFSPVTVKDSNWAGIGIVLGPTATGEVTSIANSFKVPPEKCNPLSSLPQAAGFKAALDGVSSSDYEFVAVVANCPKGATAATYSEAATVPLSPHVTIKVGQIISENVTFSAGVFTYELKDVTTGKSSTGVSTAISPPLNAGTCYIDRLPGDPLLANFTRASFGKDNTKVANTCYATANGKTLAIGAFTTPFVVQEWVMYNSKLTKQNAVPSALSSDKSSFKITFKAAGP